MTKPELTSVESPQLFLAQLMSGVRPYRFLGGLACVFSCRSPAKETSNEDSAALIPYTEDSGIMVVADGVGGYALGDRASALTVEVLRDSLRESSQKGDPLREAVLGGIEKANREVMTLQGEAATTLALIELHGSKARPFHVGDSMVCVIGQRGKLKLLTVAHSPVGFAIEAGLLTEQEAMHHEDRHLVSNIIGREEMRVDEGDVCELSAKDTVLLATDGLFDNLFVDEVVDLVRKGPLEESVYRLAAEAVKRMVNAEENKPSKPDDMTIIAFRRSDS